MKQLDCDNIVQDISCIDNVFLSVAPKSWIFVTNAPFESLPQSVKDIYFNHKDNCVYFKEFSSNPKYEEVMAGVNLFKLNEASLIIAVGGGSAIDVAKCIKLFSQFNDSNPLGLKDYFEQENNIELVAIPTTAGTGSESTKHAVIYANGVKQSICSAQIIPEIVILEPKCLETLPKYQKTATMLDALCQACESWWSKSATEESISYSKRAIELIINNWKQYIDESYNETVAKNMLSAANYAGRAINITATTAAHAMSYKLSSMFKLPHGIAVALCFPVVWKQMAIKNIEVLNDKFLDIAKSFNCKGTASAILYFKKILDDCGIVSPKTTDNNTLDALASSVNPERLSNNPIIFSKDELKEMYKEILS